MYLIKLRLRRLYIYFLSPHESIKIILRSESTDGAELPRELYIYYIWHQNIYRSRVDYTMYNKSTIYRTTCHYKVSGCRDISYIICLILYKSSRIYICKHHKQLAFLRRNAQLLLLCMDELLLCCNSCTHSSHFLLYLLILSNHTQ